MRALQILTQPPSIREIDIPDTLEAIYEAIGCTAITTALNFNADSACLDTLYVDDEGLLKPNNPLFALSHDGRDHWFAGNGLVLGVNVHDGASTDARIHIVDLAEMVSFSNRFTNAT